MRLLEIVDVNGGVGKMEKVIRQVLMGNLCLIVCSVFYLLWWILAFKPVRPVTGMRSGWLLFPALIFGVAAVVQIIGGIQAARLEQTIIPGGWILPVSAAAYVLLALITGRFMNRPVTTELILIVAWTALTLAEVNLLYGTGAFSFRTACSYLAATVLFALIDLAAYILYYDLDTVTSYVDGMIPLLLAALMMGAISVHAFWSLSH